MEALLWWNMSNDMCKAFILLELHKFFLKPFDLVSWISSVVKELPVHVITGLHIDCNNFTL